MRKILKWSSKDILNSITLDLWEAIEKEISSESTGPEIFGVIIRKNQILNASNVIHLVK